MYELLQHTPGLGGHAFSEVEWTISFLLNPLMFRSHACPVLRSGWFGDPRMGVGGLSQARHLVWQAQEAKYLTNLVSVLFEFKLANNNWDHLYTSINGCWYVFAPIISIQIEHTECAQLSYVYEFVLELDYM